MKRNSLLILSFISFIIFSSCKKTTDTSDPVQTEPIVTPIGTAAGDPVSKKIGPSGGSIVSSDGHAELIFPEGALTLETDIVVQPIVNHMPNGIQKAYRFTPDGLTFSKPVVLKIHYTAEDAAATQPDLMGIGFQDSLGGWWRVNNFTNDASGKIISAPIMHFSDWAEFDMIFINPPTAAIGVNKTVSLDVDIVASPDEIMSLDPRANTEIAPLLKVSAATITCSANGVENGNTTFGTVSSGSFSVATYTAPAKVPAQNPIAVSALVDVKFTYHGKVFDKTRLTSNISITGEKYLLEIVERRDELQLGIWVKDSVSMDVDLGGDVAVITNIKNFSPMVGNPANVTTNGCTFSYIPESIGEINVTEATGEMRIQSPTERAVQFFFTHNSTVDFSYRQYCPVPGSVPFDVTKPNDPTDGSPLTLFFDLTDSIAHDDNLTLSYYKLNATLTRKKE